MYFGKSMKKIKKIIKEEDILVNSSINSDEKNLLKFVTYELENGQRHYSIIDNNYIDNVYSAKKFLSKFHRIANTIEENDFNHDYKELANDIRLEFERGNPKAPITVCGKYACNALRYEQEYYKAVEYIDYCFASGKNLDALSSDDKTCWVMSHIYDIGDMIDVNTLNAMTITSNLINKTGTDANGYLPSKGFTKSDYMNGTVAHLKTAASLMNNEKEIPDYQFIESVYGKDAVDALKEII
jgi:hypothetical protein